MNARQGAQAGVPLDAEVASEDAAWPLGVGGSA